jgi:hypothetical protein
MAQVPNYASMIQPIQAPLPVPSRQPISYVEESQIDFGRLNINTQAINLMYAGWNRVAEQGFGMLETIVGFNYEQAKWNYKLKKQNSELFGEDLMFMSERGWLLPNIRQPNYSASGRWRNP